MEPFIGQIIMFAGSFAPVGWAFCDGQLLQIRKNEALFSVLGTQYGGDGRVDFALPDLRGRFAMHPGAAPGLRPYELGERGGRETQMLTEAEMPSHNHGFYGELAVADKRSPQGNMLALSPVEPIYAAPTAAVDRTFFGDSVGNTGGGQAFSVRNPYAAVNFIIALVGIFPART